MKIILAIFTIACIAAFLAIGPDDASPAVGEIGTIASLAAGAPSVLSNTQPTATSAPTSTVADHGDGGTADNLLRTASERLDRCHSVSALLRYRINLFDSELIGSGLYQQAGQGSGRRYRLELKTQLGDKLMGLLHVCDADTLWTYRERSPAPQLERLVLGRVRAAQSEAARQSPTFSMEELAAGGLSKLLAGLRSSFRSLHAEEGYLGELPMWAIELDWKPTALAALIPDQKEQINTGSADFSNLAQIPERVMVYFGHEDLFPRRIEFRKRASAVAAVNGAEQGRAGDYVPVVAVEFTDIRFNEPIDPRQFTYATAGAVDVTEAFLQTRGLPLVR